MITRTIKGTSTLSCQKRQEMICIQCEVWAKRENRDELPLNCQIGIELSITKLVDLKRYKKSKKKYDKLMISKVNRE